VTILKSIVVCLALANIGYFLWFRGIAQSQEVAAAAPSTKLRLASEAGDAAHDAFDSTPGTTGSGTTGSATTTDGLAAASGSGGAGAARPDDGAAALLTNVKRCVSVGPFRDVAEAAKAASTLRSGGYDPRQRVSDGDVWAGFWLYLPLPPTHAAAEQEIAKLKAAGIEDALEMPGPADGSVISLGLFSDQKRVQARIVQAQALGFNPGIADRKRTGNVYWVDVDLKPTDGLLKPSDLQGETGHITRLEIKGCPSVAAAQP
jgi:hypothetical protein